MTMQVDRKYLFIVDLNRFQVDSIAEKLLNDVCRYSVTMLLVPTFVSGNA